MNDIYCKEYLKQANNEELIVIYKQHNCSFKAIQKAFKCSKNMVDRLYTKRGIDYHTIREQFRQQKIQDYYNSPKYCINCGKVISYENRRNNFCNQSCSAIYNNSHKQSKIHNQYCIYCGKELTKLQKQNDRKYCSMTCKQQDTYNKYIECWKTGNETGIIGKYDIHPYIRRYLFEKYNSSCQLCGWNKINPVTYKIPLQIHHIDGNCLNNKEENLQLLCPNCHSLTETFGSLNRNSARVYRIKKEVYKI